MAKKTEKKESKTSSSGKNLPSIKPYAERMGLLKKEEPKEDNPKEEVKPEE